VQNISSVIQAFAVSLTTLVLLVGCNEPTLKTGLRTEDAAQAAFQACDVPLAYESVKEIFTTRCQSCHQAGSSDSIANYSDVFRIKDSIFFEVGNDFMPDNGPLAADQKKLMMAWLQAGAPETSEQVFACETNENKSVPAEPAPTPSPTPVTPAPGPRTYTELRAKILVPKCMTCHSADGSAMLYDFTDYASIVSLTDIFDRSNPADSVMIQVVKKVGRGQMPPVRSGIPRLTDEEIVLLQGWIEDGLLE
jgi:uncharacterized membrane protein